MGKYDGYLEAFYRDGFVKIPQVLSPEEVHTLRAAVEGAFEEPDDGYGGIVRVKMFERGNMFLDLMDKDGVIEFAEAVLGANCHVVAVNAVRNPKGAGIDTWHVDEDLFFPIPEGSELDPAIRMPVFKFTCNYYLVDVDETKGPTQVVPGSHRSGQHPQLVDGVPDYKGQGPVSCTGKAGDLIIFSGQTWHRGARNEHEQPRVVQQITYGRRWVSQRFYPFLNYKLPDQVYEAANPRQRRLLGEHPRGPYG
ncbi:phytanoyl-CoA dioxygenase family protein [Paenibacillus nasutitermitis]|uniref:Phytanoyl-CoA dioxygenase family protein n=1 Tax=Paenibacillus nasutitermitis TaxID=1652958 RepID=A0A917E2J9_9BACL|nr:phytanoyl-CoA dioxygenase family protein [Paenibacillus nasutitermitis]GGD97151.1 hypothetical protein GCM10010911_64860 [Paenibacillus nasutitermitis]